MSEGKTSLSRSVFPVSDVSSVSELETMETKETKETGNSIFIHTFSKKDRHTTLACIYHKHGDLDEEQAAQLSGIEKKQLTVYRQRANGWYERTEKGHKLSKLGRARLEKQYVEWLSKKQEQEKEAILVAEETPKLETLDLAEQLRRFADYFQNNHYAELAEALRKGEPSHTINFAELAKHSPELAELILENPTETLQAAKLGLQQLDVQGDTRDFRLRIRGLPESSRLSLQEIRAAHINKLLEIRADITTRSDVQPTVSSARFECPSCGNIIPVLQDGPKFRQPSGCACGRKGNFKRLSKELNDSCYLRLQNPLDEMLNGARLSQPFKAQLLGKDLCSPSLITQLSPGVPVSIVLILKEAPLLAPGGGESTRSELIAEAQNVRVLSNQQLNLEFSEKEIAEFKNAVQDKRFLHKLAESTFPDHYGNVGLKWALLCQLVAGNFTRRRAEENLHILIVGDPGTGKTQNLLMRSVELSPIGHFTDGQSASIPGILGTAAQDADSKRWYLEPGVLPRHNRGLVVMDELDKTFSEVQTALNQALASGRVSVDKAQVQAEMDADVRFLAAANPTNGRFEPGVPVSGADLTKIHATLQDRSLIFILRDDNDERRNQAVAQLILSSENRKEPPFSTEWVRRFLLFTRTNVRPVMREEERAALQNYYLTLRNAPQGSYPIGPRQLHMMRSMTLLFAKLHHRENTSGEDLKLAGEVLEDVLRPLGYDMTTLDRLAPRWNK